MINIRRWILVGSVAAAAAIILPAAASAQFTSNYGYTFNNPISASLNTMMWDSMNTRQLYKIGLRRRGFTDAQMNNMTTEELKAAYLRVGASKSSARAGSSSSTPTRAAAPSNPATRFRSSGKLVLVPQVVASLSSDQAQQRVLTAMFADAIKVYEAEAKAARMDNDVAGALAFFASVAFYLQDGSENEKGTEALANAIRESLDTSEYRSIPDIDKQRFYEFMLTMGTFLFASAKDADAETMTTLKDVSADVCSKFLGGLDPRKHRLTDDGIAAR